MNRTYRLVWNRALRVLQVASELAGSHGGAAGAQAVPRPRRHPLAAACIALLALGAFSLPVWAAGSQGGAGGAGSGAYGGNGGNGNGGGGQGGSGWAGAIGSNGNGGTGGHGGSAISAGGSGGSVGVTTMGNTSVTGGNGTDGQTDPGTSFMSGGGGGGGDGVYTADTSIAVGAGLAITGGNGGNAGNGDRIGGGGGAGGAGLATLTDASTFSNAGSITGGNGGNGGSGQWSGGGGGGGDGILVSGANGSLTNSGSIAGGAGGASGGITSFSGLAGEGGAGIDLAGDSTLVTNSGSIAGGDAHTAAGAGITGGNGSQITNQAGGSIVGGDTLDNYTTGGSGIAAATSGAQTFIIDNAGTIRGGIGADATGGFNGNGTGGNGIQATGNVTIGNSGLIEGGHGGSNSGGGHGGTGIAITVASGEQADITNRTGGVIRGGYGGVTGSGNLGGTGIDASGNVSIVNQSGAAILGDDGGLSDISTSGGTAIVATGGASIDNSGTIAGTGGIIAGTAISASATVIVNRAGGTIQGGNGQDANTGAAAIVASGQTSIDNSGDLIGGQSSVGGVQASAVVLFGGGNTMLLRAGSSITGNVVSNSGSGVGGDSFILGGDDNAIGGNTFDTGTATGFASYQKSGASTWTLTGTGSTAQNWSIAAGTLVGDSTSLAGNIDDAAALVFNQAADGSFGGIVSGTGSLAKTGTGTLVLTGANTYGGGTTIDAGTLSVSSDANLGAATNAVTLDGGTLENTVAFTTARGITLAGAGTLQIDADLTDSGVISGAGVLTKTGIGTLTLTGANTWTGGTTISTGTVQVGSGGTSGAIGTGAIVDNGALVFDRSDSIALAGAISGSGILTKQGTNTLTVNGDGSAFTGTTTIPAGTLIVGDDSHASAALGGMVTIAKGATLTGIGMIGGMDLSGTLSPGGSIGTFHVTGDATFEAGSTFNIEANADGTADQLVVGGKTAIKGGNTVVLSQPGNWNPSTTYTIITSGGGVSGTFSGVSDNQAFLTPTLGYKANDVTLTLARNDVAFPDVANTPNEKGAAAGIEGVGSGTALYDAVVKLNAADARVAFDQTSGEYHASQQTARIDDSRYVREAMNQRLRTGDADAETAKLGDTNLTAWAHAWGHWGTVDGDGNAAKLADNGDGLLIGADMPVGTQVRIGVTGGASRNSLSINNRDSWGKETSTWLGAFAGYDAGAFGLRGGIAYAWDRIPSNREIAFPGYTDRLSGNATGDTLTGFIEGSWTFHFAKNGSVSPFLNVAHTKVETNASTEAGGAAALHAFDSTANVSFSTLGARGEINLAHHLNVHGELGWQHAFGDTTPEADLQFVAGGPAFTEYGVPVAKNAGLGRIGLGWHEGNVAVDADYEGLAGNGVKDQAAKVSVSITF